MAEQDISVLDRDIKAFVDMKADLEAHHMGKWVLFHDQEMIGAFDTFNDAVQEAAQRFGKGPYLIREVGATKPTLSASVLFQPVNA